MNLTITDLNRMLDNGMDVYKHFMGPNILPNRKYLSPLRDEKDPSFQMYPNRKSGLIHYSDFGIAGRNFEGNHWQFLIDKLGTDFRGAVEYAKKQILCIDNGPLTIKVDPKVFETKQTTYSARKVTLHSHVVREWTDSDAMWWQAFRIAQSTRELFYVMPVRSYVMRKEEGLEVKEFTIYERQGDPIYWIHFPETGRSKMYRPLCPNEKLKWTSDTIGKEDVFGLHLLPTRAEKGFLFAGNKDTMSAWQNIINPLGYACIALNSESMPMFPELWSILLSITPRWYSCYDLEPDKVKYNDAGQEISRRNVANETMTKFQHDWGIIPANQILARYRRSENEKMDVAKMIGQAYLQGGEAALDPIKQFFSDL